MKEPQKTQVQSLGSEDPLEKEMATNSNIFTWRIPWTGEAHQLEGKGGQLMKSPSSAASQVAQMVRNLPVMGETWVQSLGQEDPLEKGMTAHSSILRWRIQWTEEPSGLLSMLPQRAGHDWATNSSLPYKSLNKLLNLFLFYSFCFYYKANSSFSCTVWLFIASA